MLNTLESPGSANEKTVHIFNKKIPVYQRGAGQIPLLIIGPAGLFKKPNMLPQTFDEVFTIYFVDLFEKTQTELENITNLTLDDFVAQLEAIRAQLGLKKIALFGHSANGILAFEYASKHPNNVFINILVSTAPIWGNYKNEVIKKYFDQNAIEERQALYRADQARLTESMSNINATGELNQFVIGYNARRAHFYFQPESPVWETLWDNLHLDQKLVSHFFSLVKDYDIRDRHYDSGIPTFLGLGLYDYSCPFYVWTDEAKAQLSNIEYYIFKESGHYSQVEEFSSFSTKLFAYMERNQLISFEKSESLRLKIQS